MAEFIEWPKTPRLFRDIVITEKIDGTNAGIHIEKLGDVSRITVASEDQVRVGSDVYRLTAQSRKRLIYPGKGADNYDFAAWVQANAARLVELLGEGLHFGEWWGRGINRAYNCEYRHFSLFNTDRYAHVSERIAGSRVMPVPVLYHGPFSEEAIRTALTDLQSNGSRAVHFAKPEGICVFHAMSKQIYKVTLDNQDAGKWEVASHG